MLIEATSSGKDVQVELAHAGDLDVTAVQLLWAAKREAENVGVGFANAGVVPGDIGRATSEAGFEDFMVPVTPPVTPKAGPANRLSSTGTPDD